MNDACGPSRYFGGCRGGSADRVVARAGVNQADDAQTIAEDRSVSGRHADRCSDNVVSAVTSDNAAAGHDNSNDLGVDCLGPDLGGADNHVIIVAGLEIGAVQPDPGKRQIHEDRIDRFDRRYPLDDVRAPAGARRAGDLDRKDIVIDLRRDEVSFGEVGKLGEAETGWQREIDQRHRGSPLRRP